MPIREILRDKTYTTLPVAPTRRPMTGTNTRALSNRPAMK